MEAYENNQSFKQKIANDLLEICRLGSDSHFFPKSAFFRSIAKIIRPFWVETVMNGLRCREFGMINWFPWQHKEGEVNNCEPFLG